MSKRIVTYPSPLNVRKIEQMAERTQMSKSKIVNEALSKYFNEKKDRLK